MKIMTRKTTATRTDILALGLERYLDNWDDNDKRIRMTMMTRVLNVP